MKIASLLLMIIVTVAACKPDAEVPRSAPVSTHSDTLQAMKPLDTTQVLLKDTMVIEKWDSAIEVSSSLSASEESVATKATTTVKQLPKRPKKRAYLTFNQTVYDFGEIEEGDIIEYDFEFTNTGEAPLNITNADVTCGCTFPSIPFIATAPGESAKVGVQYNSVNKFGPQEATITLYSDAANKEVQLKVRGFVKGEPEELKLYDPRDAVKQDTL